jgi:hypothetical protein
MPQLVNYPVAVKTLPINVSGQNSRREILTSHVFGSSASVTGGAANQNNPGAKRQAHLRTTLTDADEPYTGRDKRAGTKPEQIYFDCVTISTLRKCVLIRASLLSRFGWRFGERESGTQAERRPERSRRVTTAAVP